MVWLFVCARARHFSYLFSLGGLWMYLGGSMGLLSCLQGGVWVQTNKPHTFFFAVLDSFIIGCLRHWYGWLPREYDRSILSGPDSFLDDAYGW
jgi:hypothetical protein